MMVTMPRLMDVIVHVLRKLVGIVLQELAKKYVAMD